MEKELQRALRESITRTEVEMKYHPSCEPDIFFKNHLENMIDSLNKDSIEMGRNEIIILDEIEIKEENFSPLPIGVLTGIGTILYHLGQPYIKKRFVTPGSAKGTSVASKYLSKLFPGKLPFNLKLFRTTVTGRFLGRLVPWVGGGLILIDGIRVFIEFREDLPYHNYELNREAIKRGHRIWGDDYRPNDGDYYKY